MACGSGIPGGSGSVSLEHSCNILNPITGIWELGYTWTEPKGREQKKMQKNTKTKSLFYVVNSYKYLCILNPF